MTSHEEDGVPSRVHFQAEAVQQHDSEIIIKPVSDSKIEVHLGFLQVHHCYEVKFSIKDTLHEDITFDPLQNLHAKIANYMPSEDGEGHELMLELSAHKEKLWREELTIRDSLDPAKAVRLLLHARVLGKGKGTPMLKRGIHCKGINVDEDSEQSDWQGFD